VCAAGLCARRVPSYRSAPDLTSSPAPWLTGWRDEKNEARDGTHSGDEVTKLVKAVPVRMSSSISGVSSGAQLLGRPRPQSS